MKRLILLYLTITLMAGMLCAGCTNPAPVIVVPSPTPAPLPTTPLTTVPTSTPSAVQTLPAEMQVYFDLSKDRTDSRIYLIYQGGKGEIFVQSIRMRVTRSDGQVKDLDMDKPKRGDELVAEGTRGSDRVEVWVTSAGTMYKVRDEFLVVSGFSY